MTSRADSQDSPRPDPELGVDPGRAVVADQEGGPQPAAGEGRTDDAINYAASDFVLASARRMLEIHRDTFRKLAE